MEITALALAAKMKQWSIGLKDDTAMRQGAELVKSEAKAAIGTYRYGWPRLKPATVARKGKDTPLLQTGELKNSIESQKVGEHQYEVGSTSKKAVWHELGTPRIPPRPFLSEAARRREAQVHKLIDAHVRKTLGV